MHAPNTLMSCWQAGAAAGAGADDGSVDGAHPDMPGGDGNANDGMDSDEEFQAAMLHEIANLSLQGHSAVVEAVREQSLRAYGACVDSDVISWAQTDLCLPLAQDRDKAMQGAGECGLMTRT